MCAARLGHNQIPIISWKGKTFSQIVASVKKNTNTSESTESYARAGPMKHYRREITTGSGVGAGSRNSVKIALLEGPASTIVNSATCGADDCVGITQTLDATLTESRTERPCHPDSTEDDFTLDFSAASNARRRCRSSGVIRKSVRPGTTNDMYKTSNAQYLESRGLTYKQNQYNFVKEGDKTAIPGDVMSMNNIYVGNNMQNYAKLLISAANNNNWFQYQWLDAATYTITLDDDYYDAIEFTKFIQKKMRSAGHYLTDSGGNYEYLIQMYYNNYSQCFTITCKAASSTIQADYTVAGSGWSLPTTTVVPCVIIPSTDFTKVVGIAAGTYPAVAVDSQSSTYGSDQTTTGRTPRIRPAYKPIYYKPNNINYSQQGGVSSGERLARVKYNTITTAASSYRTSYGSQTAAAYAYGGTPTGVLNSLKLKYGFPNTCVPIVKETGEQYDSRMPKCATPANKHTMRGG